MIGELRSRVTDGGSDNSIMNWFAAKYGATVLAAPMRGGFDTVAWIAPFVVFVLATLGTAFVVRVWKRRADRFALTSAPLLEPPEVLGSALRERIRRESGIGWD